MDNKAYLDTIAVKGKDSSRPSLPILSPTIIKLVAVGVVAIIAMIVVAMLLNNSNKSLTVSYEKIYATYTQLAAPTSPITQYQPKLKSSTIRAATTQLQTSINNTNVQLKNVIGQVGVDPAAISEEATTAVTTDITTLSIEFESGYYAGTLDYSYATAVYAQISKMIAVQTEARQQTENAAFAAVLDTSLSDLKTIQEQFKNFIDAA